MFLTALYKTFEGEEFVEASLASIYDHVDAIVMVHSDVSWTGQTGNTVRPVVEGWKELHDHVGKIHSVNVSLSAQEEQYRAGVDYIRARLPQTDIILVVDCDEVWEGQYLQRARHQIQADPNKMPAYRCNMHTYLKLPFYRVDPPFGSPTTFVREFDALTQSPRAHKSPAKQLADVWFHHYTYVRRSWAAIERKLASSALADKSDEQVRPDYKTTVWNRLPHDAENLHGFVKWAHVWPKVKTVWLCDMPEETRAVSASYLPPDPGYMDSERTILFQLAQGKDVCVDLGTCVGHSAAILSLGSRRVFTFDLFEDVVGSGAKRNRWGEDDDLYETMYQRKPYPYDMVKRRLQPYANVCVFKRDTNAAAEQFEFRSVDMAFIDADHSYEGVKSNFDAWLPRMKVGGLMLFHDNSDLHPGPARLCEELKSYPGIKPFKLPEYEGTLWAYTRQR